MNLIKKVHALEWKIFFSFIVMQTIVLAVNLNILGLTLKAAIFSSLNNSILVIISSVPILYFTRFLYVGRYPFFMMAVLHFISATFYCFIYYVLRYYAILLSSGEDLVEQAFKDIEWQVWGTYIIYFLIIGMSYSVQYINELRKKEKVEFELRKQVQAAQLEALRYQLNPHFLFNSLNNINALVASRPEEAREMIVLLSDFLRVATNRENKELVLLQEELDQVNRYLEIEQIRFNDRLKLDVNNKVKQDLLIPPLLIQPLVENVIKHGVSKTSDHIKILIDINIQGEYVLISVFNSLEEPVTTLNYGTGLRNIEKRLKTNYGDKANLTINIDEGFEVLIRFPSGI